MKVHASLVSDKRIVCVTPPTPHATGASDGIADYFLDISIDGHSYTDAKRRFAFWAPVRLRAQPALSEI